jgi:hypothetical protein
MKQWMPFVVALVSLTAATLRIQGISPSTQPKLPAAQHARAGRQIQRRAVGADASCG